MKRWLSWWAQSRTTSNNGKGPLLREPRLLGKVSADRKQQIRNKEVMNDYGISLRRCPREIAFYNKYVDTNTLSMVPHGTASADKSEDPDRKMDLQLYHDFIGAKDDPARFISCGSRPNLSYEAFLSQDFSQYSPAPQVPQDAVTYASACECAFDSVGAYAVYSAHCHARTTRT